MNVRKAIKALFSDRTIETGVEYIEGASDYSFVLSSDVTSLSYSYLLCPPLQQVIGKRSQGVLQGKLIPVDKEENYIKTASFDKAMKLLSKPNRYESYSQFVSNMSTYIDVFGICYIYKVESVGFGLSGLIIIPNPCMSVQYKSYADVLGGEGIVESYTVSLFGNVWTFRGDDTRLITEVRDRTVSLRDGMRPYSRIQGLKYPVQNIIASLESRNQIIVKRGADVVFSPEVSNDKGVNATFLNNQEVKDIQTAYSRYGSIKGLWHAAILKVPTKVQQITRNPKDLGLLDGEDSDIRSILRAYNVPATVFGLKDENKYNTYLEGKTEFYEDSIIPHAGIIAECFDNIFDSAKNGYLFYFDFSHLACMQKSEREKAEAFGKYVSALNEAVAGNLVTIEEARDLIKDYLS